MSPRRAEALDLLKLSPAARRFASELFAALPQLSSAASMDRPTPQGWSLRIYAPSPTGDPDRALVISIEDDVPMLEFAGWHDHGTRREHHPRRSEFVGLVEAILRDQFVIAVDVGGQYDGHRSPVDLRVPDELRDLADRGGFRIISWSGAADSIVPRHAGS